MSGHFTILIQAPVPTLKAVIGGQMKQDQHNWE